MDVGSLCDELIRDLDEAYSPASPSKAARLVEMIEERIARALKEAILKNIHDIDDKVRRTGDGFVFEGDAFEVIIGYRDIVRDHALAVVLGETGQRSKPIIERFALNGPGKFTKADLIFSPRLRKFIPNAAALTKGFYESGYAWLNEFLKEKSRELESSMSVELFRQLRIAFGGRPELADVIWLFVTDTNKGTYFFDERAAEHAVKRITKLRGSVRRSSAEIFLGLLTTEVPYEQIFGRHSVETGNPLRVDLSKAEYLESKPIVALAEHVLYQNAMRGSQTATVFALTRDQQPYLLCCFPSLYETEIVSTLRAHASQIETTFNEHKTTARRYLKALKEFSPLSLPIEDLGKFAGGFFRGFSGH